MVDLSLENLHLAARYRKNIGVLVEEVYKIYDSLRNFVSVDELQNVCGELFESIRKSSFDIDPYLYGRKSLSELTKMTSFSSLLSGLPLDRDILELSDFISFKIVDFAFVFGNERARLADDKKFSKWNLRSPQLLFKQKGQLWLLNCLSNIAKFEKEKSAVLSPQQTRDFIRKTIDKDFSPYPEGLSDTEVDRKIQEVRALSRVENRYPEFDTPVDRLSRRMGFEVEHQIPYPDAEKLNVGKEGEFKLLEAAGKIYHEFGYPILSTVKVGSKIDPKDVMDYGSLTRDPSNVRYPGYMACEYSSPVGNLAKLKHNASELCELFEKLGGGLVREDCGTHVHVSIEDLKDNPEDSAPLKIQKLEALKRILRNFILLRKEFESVLPEYRRGDNSLYSGQAHATFVDGDQEFILGLINSCKNYEELRSVLMVGGKYLSLAPFSNTFEFRSFPATTNSEVLACWFELLNKFVDSSIRGVELEKCLDEKLLERLKILTKGGTVVFGMLSQDPEDICFGPCNSIDYSRFTEVKSPTLMVASGKIKTTTCATKPTSRIGLYGRTAEYVQGVQTCLYRLDYAEIRGLDDCSVAMSIDRTPGDTLKSVPVSVPRNIPSRLQIMPDKKGLALKLITL